MKDDDETYSIPMMINQQISREKIRRVTNLRIVSQGGDKKHSVNGCSGKTVSTTKGKVVTLGDSHLKSSVPRIGNYLSSKFEVSGFIKPGAGFEKIVQKSIMGSSRLTDKMCLCAMVVLMMSTTIPQKR